jgi:hypothetical protein
MECTCVDEGKVEKIRRMRRWNVREMVSEVGERNTRVEEGTCTHVGYVWGSMPKWKNREIRHMIRD